MRFINFIQKHKGFIFLFLFTLLWIVSLVLFSPQEIVSFIGIEGGYLLIFATALVGISGFSSMPFYATFITLASTGDFNFFALLLSAVPAMAIGDSIFFLVGHRAHFAVSELTEIRIKKLSTWISKRHFLTVPLFAYIYTSISPLPQDVLMIALGVGKARFKYVIIAVLLGNATFLTMIYFFSVFIFPEIII